MTQNHFFIISLLPNYHPRITTTVDQRWDYRLTYHHARVLENQHHNRCLLFVSHHQNQGHIILSVTHHHNHHTPQHGQKVEDIARTRWGTQPQPKARQQPPPLKIATNSKPTRVANSTSQTLSRFYEIMIAIIDDRDLRIEQIWNLMCWIFFILVFDDVLCEICNCQERHNLLVGECQDICVGNSECNFFTW